MIERLKRSDVLLHGAIVFGGVLVSNVFNYLYYVLIGRRAGVVVLGEVTALTSALLVAGAPAQMVQFITARIAAGLWTQGDRAGLRRLADLVTLGSAAAGACVVLIAVLAGGAIARFFNLDSVTPVILCAVALGIFAVAYVQRGVLQGAHLFEAYSTSVGIEASVKVAFVVVLVQRFGTSGAFAATICGLALAAAYNTVQFRRRLGALRGSPAISRATLLRVVGGVGLGQLTLTVLQYYDVSVVKHAFDARSAGLYAAAALVGRAVVAACSFVPLIVLPKATARVAAGRSPLSLLLAAAGIAGAFIAVALAASAIAPEFVVTTIAGRSFGAAAPLVLGYVVSSAALALATVIASYNFGLHRYAFVVPAAVVACGEIVTLAVWHPTLPQVVGVLIAGHACLLAATLYRVNAPVPASRRDEIEADVPAVEPVG